MIPKETKGGGGDKQTGLPAPGGVTTYGIILLFTQAHLKLTTICKNKTVQRMVKHV